MKTSDGEMRGGSPGGDLADLQPRQESTGDIVVWLRNEAAAWTNLTPKQDERLCYAADEIERLRDVLRDLDEVFDKMLDERIERQRGPHSSHHNAGWIDALEHVLGIMRLRAASRTPAGTSPPASDSEPVPSASAIKPRT